MGTHYDGTSRETRALDTFIKLMRASDSVDAELKRSDGAEISVNAAAVPLRGLNGEAVGFMIVLEDITSEKRVKSTMARYMTKEVADKLLEGGDEALGGTSQTATVLFSDIRKFTTISEALGARDTVVMLNAYFTEMIDVIFHHKGILDKYIGDAIMAVFGVPFAAEKDAENSVLAANDMIRALRRINSERVLLGVPEIHIGVGLNTGDLISGNIGSGRTIALRVNSTTFDQDVRLFIASETLAACGNIDSAISIIASPSAELRAPLEIEIHYLPADAGNITDPAKLAIVRYNPGSRTCVPLKSRLDGNLALGTLRVTAETNHLSVFKVMQIQPTGSISDMRVFPNPLFTHSQVYFTFDQLPAGARVRVYTLHGEEVFDGTANASGLLTWNARNKYGRSVASGIYLAVVEGGGEKKILKVVVVR